jgi:hypothetical protein
MLPEQNTKLATSSLRGTDADDGRILAGKGDREQRCV